MPTSQNQTTNSSSTTNPWAPQAAALQSAFGAAGNALGTAQSNGVTPSGFVAGMTPAQLATFQSMIGYGGANSALPAVEANAGSSLVPAATGVTSGALSGLLGFNPSAADNMGAITSGANAYASGIDIPAQVQAAMQSANEEAQDVELPGINTNAAATGNVNSSGTGVAQGIVQRGLAEQAGNIASELQANAYNTGAGLASSTAQANNAGVLSALGSAAGGGTNALGTGLGALSGAINDQGNLFNIASTGGAGEQAAQQATYDNQNQAYQFSQNSPFEALSNYMGIVGSNNWGGTTTGTAQTQTTPSIWSVIGGLMGAGGSLAKGFSGMGTGGGS